MAIFENNLRFQIIFPVSLVMGTIVLALTWLIPSLVQENAEQRAFKAAVSSLEQFKILRIYYTDQVVKKVQLNSSLTVGIDHQNDKNKIPLPATMIHDLSDLFAQNSNKYSLYSAYPFPNRDRRELDGFQTFAWQAFQTEPDEVIQRKININQQILLRVAISDRMEVQACVDCHNSHPLTPKNDWQLNDVRGVLEATIDITEQLALAKLLSTWIVSAILAASFILITIFFFLTRRITKQVSNVSNAMYRLGQGDDSAEVIQHSGTKEVDQMVKVFQLFKDTLNDRQALEKQKQLFENEKITALGTMVSGIAHEVNTPIGISVTAASFLQEQSLVLENKLESNELTQADLKRFLSKNHESLDILSRNLTCAADLISSFKQVSVDQVSEESREVVLSNYLQEIILSLRPKIRKASVIVNLQHDNDYPCLILPGALSQVITNLIMNSITHGFGERKGGIITITTDVRKSGKVTICYSDDGVGIDEEIIDKIMEPFFTTKRGEGGSGLGLSIIHNIVTHKFKGTIKISSPKDIGVNIDIQFNSIINY